MRHPDGIWGGYTYEWNGAGTDADLVQGGKISNINGQDWLYPSSAQCQQCHTQVVGRSIGPQISQLNRNLTYPTTGRTANQLATLENIGIFSAALPDQPGNLPVMPDPVDQSDTLENRAKAYLHINCAQCHQPGGPTNVSMDLRFDTPLSAMGICNVVPQNGDLGLLNARIIVPGTPASSVLPERMGRRDVFGMPPLGSLEIDTNGMVLINQWISSFSVCP